MSSQTKRTIYVGSYAFCVDETFGAKSITRAANQLSMSFSPFQCSRQLAENNLQEITKCREIFTKAENNSGIPASLLAAIASRESHVGTFGLDGNGWSTMKGNKGYGMMQIDKSAHSIVEQNGRNSLDHVIQAAHILNNFLDQIKKKPPCRTWNASDQLRGAVAAYNFGVANVQSIEKLDEGTSPGGRERKGMGDYSADVIVRASVIQEKVFSKVL